MSHASRQPDNGGRFWGSRTQLVLGLVVAMACVPGCASVKARYRPLPSRFSGLGEKHGLTDTTREVLDATGLPPRIGHTPSDTASLVHATGSVTEPARALALADISYRSGLRAEHLHLKSKKKEALKHYRDALLAATGGLSIAPDTPSPVTAETVELSNKALERLLVLADELAEKEGRYWFQVLREIEVNVGSSSPRLEPMRYATVRPAAQYKVRGIATIYGSSGLGVPVVAHRLNDSEASSDLQDRFLPPEVDEPATVVAHVESGRPTAPRVLNLVLHDPFEEGAVAVQGKGWPMASDRSTALAVQVASSGFELLETVGLLRPDEWANYYGVYMSRRYDPAKIPVVFVHGLNSSPRAWIETINELQNDPQFDKRYQFWFFMYPTGVPIVVSQARLRESLRSVRATIDPEGDDPATNNIVVVGHSMGGVLTRLLTVDSGSYVWDRIINIPRNQVRATPETLAQLDRLLFFRPEPYVRRAIFVAAPHRGSPMAQEPIGNLVSKLIQPAGEEQKLIDELVAANGPGAVSNDLNAKPLTSVYALRPDGPIASVADCYRPDPTIPTHSIILFKPGRSQNMPTDGVVPYWSSHLDYVQSEVLIEGAHGDEGKPEVTAEIKRILRIHLQQPTPEPLIRTPLPPLPPG